MRVATFVRKMESFGYLVTKYANGTANAVTSGGNGYFITSTGLISKVEDGFPTYVYVAESDLKSVRER